MGQVGLAIVLALIFGPIALCVIGFYYHPVAGGAAVGNLIAIIVLYRKKQEEMAGRLWIISAVLTLIFGSLSAAGLLK